MPSRSMMVPISATSPCPVDRGCSALMGVLLPLPAGRPLAGGGVLPGGSQALAGATGDRSGARRFGAVGKVLLAGLDAGLDGAADDRVGAVLGGLGVLLEPRPRH